MQIKSSDMSKGKILILIFFMLIESEIIFAISLNEVAIELSGYGKGISLIEINKDDIYIASGNNLYRQKGIKGRKEDISKSAWKESIGSLREIDFKYQDGIMWFIGTQKPFCTIEKNYFGLFSNFDPCPKDTKQYDFDWVKKEFKGVSRIGEKQEINNDRTRLAITHFKGPVQLYSKESKAVVWEYWQNPRSMWSRDVAINNEYVFFANVSEGGIIIRRLADGKNILIEGEHAPDFMDVNGKFLVFDNHLKGVAYIRMKTIDTLFY